VEAELVELCMEPRVAALAKGEAALQLPVFAEHLAEVRAQMRTMVTQVALPVTLPVTLPVALPVASDPLYKSQSNNNRRRNSSTVGCNNGGNNNDDDDDGGGSWGAYRRHWQHWHVASCCASLVSLCGWSGHASCLLRARNVVYVLWH